MSAPSPEPVDAETLRYLWTPDLNPLFWRRGRTGVVSAWYGHVPFAHWIVAAVKPRTLVELGTHNGVSYSAFCEAVVCNGLETRCFAVDTWQGDDQAGHYGEEVYGDLRSFHDERYSAFSELLRCTFDDALAYVPDASVDLLHIDGLHTYEAVQHDYENWRPKLSDGAVVLFHDTNVRERDFGVWRLWEELRTQYPSFEFLHGHGLGVLAIGRSVSTQVAALCSLRDPQSVHTIRQRFSLLGERWIRLDPREQPQAREARILALEAEATRRCAAEAQLRARAAQRSAQARAEAATAIVRVADAEARAKQAQTEAVKAMARAAAAEEKSDAVKNTARLVIESGPESEASVAETNTAPLALKSGIRLLYISGQPDTPGNLYRVVRYVEAATAAGAQASWIRLDEVPEHTKEIAETDILVIWRAAWDERVAYAVKAARSAGARVVFDIDDLLVDSDLVRADLIDGIRTSGLTEQQWQGECDRFHATMVAADYCTVPTEELATNIRRFCRSVMVLPNGFDRATYLTSRRSVRGRRSAKSDGLVRIGYAGGTRTHQRDFAVAAEAVGQVLRDRPHCRLVLFQRTDDKVPLLDIGRFPIFEGIEDRIEWRNRVPLRQLPEKIAHFDVNIAPMEVGNVFCEAKSELKFFEAALVDVPTIASPTGPFRRAIRDGETGFLASNSEDWYAGLLRLVDDPVLRLRVARAAHHDVLWRYGPLRRADAMFSAVSELLGDSRAAAHAFALEVYREQASKTPAICIPDTEIAFESGQLGEAAVTVLVPLHNCAEYVEETLESARAQTLEVLDLIVVDDASTDTSLSVAVEWARRHAKRFNRIIVLRNTASGGVGLARNAGIDAADTPWVLPLDADKRLLRECGAVCLSAIGESGAAFAYPQIRRFGDASGPMGNYPFDPRRFIGGNYIDLIVLVAKEAWAGVGGYTDSRRGGEDFAFCRRLVENGLWGCPAGDAPLAEYRVHGDSKLGTTPQVASVG
jgi:glycosyltransferase involved in cell wall biosynthesis